MAGYPQARHRLAVLPGLSSRSVTPQLSGNDIGTALATIDDSSNNKQLVPLSLSNSKIALRQVGSLHRWNESPPLKSRDSEDSLGQHLQNTVSRITHLEEANKAILEEVYRIQSSVRAGEYFKKDKKREEKKIQHELMETIRASNDVIAQLTSRLRTAEEKIHHERDTVKSLVSHTQKLEQALVKAQRESDSLRDTQNSQAGELRHRVEDLTRRWEKSDRTSESIVDEFHQLKSRVDVQTMEFSHLQNELKQRSKRTEDELKQTLQQARFQKDTNSLAEQNSLQLRHLLELKIAESRDAINDLRGKLTQTENDNRTQAQKLSLKLVDLQSSINDLSHRRQEEMQHLEKSRQEHNHLEENERIKLQNRIQTAVEEMSEKLLQKEIRLREEAVKKFIDVEKLFRQEETSRVDFEKQLRDDIQTKWKMQQKLYEEEMQVMKEMRRSDRSKQSASTKRVDECLVILDKKINHERRAVEKVLLAEITKREVQSAQTFTKLDGVQEQLRVGLSTMQQAIGGLQFQSSRDKEHVLKEMKSKAENLSNEIARAVTDVDARLTTMSVRFTQQEEALEKKTNDFAHTIREEHNQMLRNTTAWKEMTSQDISLLQNAMKQNSLMIKESQERLDVFKDEQVTRVTLENESRLKENDVTNKRIRELTYRIEELEASNFVEKTKQSKLERDVIAFQTSIAQIEQMTQDAKSNLGVRINSETKMRLEETSAIKRDLARLRVDVQPLLWQNNAMGRTFVKAPVSFLNEWGIYQCARWYDIKMRWLRLLDKSRKKRHKDLKPTFVQPMKKNSPSPPEQFHTSPTHSPTRPPTSHTSAPPTRPPTSRTPAPPTLQDSDLGSAAFSAEELPTGDTFQRADEGSLTESRASTIDDRPTSGEIPYMENVRQGGENERDNPRPAWYNQDVVDHDQHEESGGEGNEISGGMERSPADSRNPADGAQTSRGGSAVRESSGDESNRRNPQQPNSSDAPKTPRSTQATKSANGEPASGAQTLKSASGTQASNPSNGGETPNATNSDQVSKPPNGKQTTRTPSSNNEPKTPNNNNQKPKKNSQGNAKTPNGSQLNAGTSNTSVKGRNGARPSQATVARGKSYDMEGSR